MLYTVTWSIEIDATGIHDAASQALAIMRDPNSLATVFDVVSEDGSEADSIDFHVEEDDDERVDSVDEVEND